MKNKIIWIVIAVVIVGGGIWLATSNKANDDNRVQSNSEQADAMMDKKDESAMMDPSTSSGQKSSDAMMDHSTGSPSASPSDTMVKTAGSYKDYSPETVAAEFAAGNKVVLFFHATWCPFCKAANKAFLKNADQIPAGVTILKTDYDSSTELKQKYGVTYQHTFVQIDSNGNEITQWSGGDINNAKKYVK